MIYDQSMFDLYFFCFFLSVYLVLHTEILDKKGVVSRENLRSLPSESTQVHVRTRVCLSRDSRLDVDILKNPCSHAEYHKDLALHRGCWKLPSFSNFLKQTDGF